MGTFRKFLFILYSRRPKSRLLVNQKKRGIIDQKILSSPLAVKGKIGFRNSLGFQAESDDLRLKYRIVGGNLKIRSTGSNSLVASPVRRSYKKSFARDRRFVIMVPL
jgi:hypothetical protein